MTRTEARKIARQMDRSGDFNFIELVEEFDTGNVRITAQNRCNMRRTVECELDWTMLKTESGR